MKPLHVSEVLRYLDRSVREDPILRRLRVEGQVANLSRGRYFYYDLKDETALVHCADFDRVLPANVQEGDQIVIEAQSMVYPAQGKFELKVRQAEPLGAGAQLLALEKLKKKLEAEGLFQTDRKRPLPIYPNRIGLITSGTGAVLHDFANEVNRRYPLPTIVLSPAQVQGKEAPRSMRNALLKLLLDPVPFDVIVFARGGGASEDLSAFNDEKLVRAIAASPVPIVSAVGHQVDLTLTDFAADRRASTPTEAAILVTPDRYDLHREMDRQQDLTRRALERQILRRRSLIEKSLMRIQQKSPLFRILRKRSSLTAECRRSVSTFQKRLQDRRQRVDGLVKSAGLRREQQLARTSWRVTDVEDEPMLPGALKIGGQYRLQAGEYRYEITVNKKEKS